MTIFTLWANKRRACIIVLKMAEFPDKNRDTGEKIFWGESLLIGRGPSYPNPPANLGGYGRDYMFKVTRALMGFFVLAGMLLLPAAASAAVHTVSAGESLYTISRGYGIALDSLMKANGLTGSLIYPGQQLTIPGGQGQNTSYIVQKGDTLYLIGNKYKVDYRRIMSTNGLSSTMIYPGMVLTIPGSASVPAVSRGGFFTRPAPEEVDLLARLITAEADGEPYNAQVAVGAVVLNRVRSAQFPGAIKDVINQHDNGTYQFTPVMNGWISRPATAQSIQAAKDALGGLDPSRGALYFFADYATNKWLWSRPSSIIIGNIVFTY